MLRAQYDKRGPVPESLNHYKLQARVEAEYDVAQIKEAVAASHPCPENDPC